LWPFLSGLAGVISIKAVGRILNQGDGSSGEP
jgi:hypothetical protein